MHSGYWLHAQTQYQLRRFEETNSAGSTVRSNNPCNKTNRCTCVVIKNRQNTFCWYTVARRKFCRNHCSTTAQHNLGYATIGFNQQRQDLFHCHWQLCTIRRHDWPWRHFRRGGDGNRRSNAIGWQFHTFFNLETGQKALKENSATHRHRIEGKLERTRRI